MNQQITSKITAFTVALIVNSMIMVGLAHLFDGQSHPQFGVIAAVGATLQSAHEVT